MELIYDRLTITAKEVWAGQKLFLKSSAANLGLVDVLSSYNPGLSFAYLADSQRK